jgi:hypothetical protein
MSNISGLFIRIEWLYVSHLLALNSAQVVLSVRNTHVEPFERKANHFGTLSSFGIKETADLRRKYD